MKKFLMVAIVVAVAGSLLASPVLAKPGASKGAVKLELHERMPGDSYFEVGSGDQVGWAILNTNADGRLIIETHLDNGTPNEIFDVWVNKYKGGSYLGDENLGTLTTNRQGKGNAHVELNLDDYDTVQVVVKEVEAVGVVGYATAPQALPLKK